jgi:hypothetical protein
MSLAVAAAVAGLAFAVYLRTLAPTVMWYDMGEFATASATLGIAHNTGYPLLILLGKLFTFVPAGDTAYRVNLMSAVFTALAVAVVFGIIHDLTDDVAASATGALTLAFASTVWANATWATSYGLNLLFTALVTRCMFTWWRSRDTGSLLGAALAFGLGMCNHRLIVLVAPPSALLLALGWRSLTPRALALAAAAIALGLSVYIYLPVRGEQEPALSWARPAEWHTYWSMFLNGQTPSAYWRLELADRIDVLWSYPSYDLTWAGLVLAGLGLVVCVRRNRAIAAYFVLLIALDAAMVETYSIHNIYNYLTPAYLGLCVCIGIAVSWLAGVVRRRDRLAPQHAPAALAALFLLLPASLLLRNYQRVDRSSDYTAYDFASTTLDRLPDHAVILTDSWTASPLWYVQLVEGRRRDVLVSPVFSVPGEDVGAFAQRQFAAGRDVYVADGLRTPHGDLERRFALRPIVLNGIEEMLSNTLPEPEFRDDLVMRGSLWKLVSEPADPAVSVVPEWAARDEPYAAGVTLAGFEASSSTPPRGDVLEFTYYWRLMRPASAELQAVTVFADDHGHAHNTRGFPTWTQSRQIGEGSIATAEWHSGELIRESYFSIVPRSISPGDYDVRVAVFDPATPGDDARRLVTVGHITVR